MSPRFILLVGSHGAGSSGLLKRLSERTGLSLVHSTAGFALLVNAACRYLPIGDHGCILGSLFRSHGPAEPVSVLSASEAASVAGSRGETLISNFWGGYLAAIADRESVRILRDPSGCFACYYASAGRHVLFASDAKLLAACDVPIDIDCEAVGRQLYRAFVPSTETALRGVRELLAGFAIRFPAASSAQQPCWSPWDHVVDRARSNDEAAERLSRVVRHCVDAWASTRRRVLLSVSGGLDSSVAAVCLAQAGTEAVCLTMFSEDAAGDERMFARLLCDHLGLRLIERAYRLEDIDVTQALAAHLPRPMDRTQANAFERVHMDVAAEIGADAFMTGNGGDHVFGYSQSAAPIADRYLASGFGPGVLRTLIEVCRQTGCSLFDALERAWRLAHRSAAFRVAPNPVFLDGDFISALGPDQLHHPWLDAPVGALPGKAAHIATILRVQPNLAAGRDAHLPVLNPLVSQPLVEACLAIPSWQWRAGGRDRALVRRAFEPELPSAILNRRVKGTPSRFAARLLDHYRGPIRERLLGGRLAAHGIVDAAALEQVLMGEHPVPDLERVRILELVNAEAWLDHWAARPKTQEVSVAGFKSAGRGRFRVSADPTR